jgi:hypothetical protein
MTQCTGIPASTQRVYERATGVAVTRHYAVSDERTTPAHVVGIRATVHAGAFSLLRKQRHCRPCAVVAWPLPNTYETSLVLARRGQTRWVNRQLRQPGPSVQAGSPSDTLLNTGDGHCQGERHARVFHPTRGVARAAARHACATGPADAWGNPSVQTEWYYRRTRRTQRGAGLWGVVYAAGWPWKAGATKTCGYYSGYSVDDPQLGLWRRAWVGEKS